MNTWNSEITRSFISSLVTWTWATTFPLLAAGTLFCSLPAQAQNKIPVIFDTDIGDDIDDTWALGFLLECPELDLRLVVGDQGRPLYRACLLAKFLQTAGRSEIPVGMGLAVHRSGDGPQADWVKDYDLKTYPGKIHEDGVQAMIDLIMKSDRPVTLVAVGPLPNVAEALRREPRIAQRARFVGMHGSVRLGYGGSKNVSAEYNVQADAKACQAALSAPWEITITPLDTCGLVQLQGDHYRKVHDARNPIAAAIIENYRIWSASRAKNEKAKDVSDRESSILFDTVAVYLAVSQEFLTMEKLGIRVTDDGYTRIDPTGKTMNVATAWKNMDGFKDFMVGRLTRP
jgi:inosine-uridine nucleoside N-ribohydrolase